MRIKTICIIGMLSFILMMGNTYASESRISQEELERRQNFTRINITRETSSLLTSLEDVMEVETWDISDTTGEDHVTATLYSDGKLVISGTGKVIPFLSNKIPWYSHNDSIITVEIQNGITSIPNAGFGYYKNLKEISIPESLEKIDGFKSQNLEKIQVDPNNKNYSDSNGILFNKDKTEIIYYPPAKIEASYQIPETVTTIGSDAFYWCQNLVNIEMPEKLTRIGDYAFYSCTKLTNVTIPKSVERIGTAAFLYCNSLTSIEVSENVQYIESEAFSKCDNLQTIHVNQNNSNYSSQEGVLFNKNKNILMCYPGGKQASTYDIPETVTVIDDYAFSHSNHVTSIKVPDNVTKIGVRAFESCDSLRSINIPTNLTKIRSGMFYDCWNLANMTIPENITSIESQAFEGCRNLIINEIPQSVTSIGKDAFKDCKMMVAVQTGTVEEGEITTALPTILKRTLEAEDIMYAQGTAPTLTNCTILEGEQKLTFDISNLLQHNVKVRINAGALNGLNLIVEVPSGTIFYSTTDWTNQDVTATLYVEEGAEITNNEKSNQKVFTHNDSFTFQYTGAIVEDIYNFHS